MKKIYLLFVISLLFTTSYAQKSSLAIIEFKSVGLEESNEIITDVIRFEIEKSQYFNLMEKEDMEYQMLMKKLNKDNCFNKLCIIYTGKSLLVNKVLTGAVSKLGDNKLITLKLYNIKTEEIEKSIKVEVISDKDQTINEVINTAITAFNENNTEGIVTKDIRKNNATTVLEENTIEEEVASGTGTPHVKYYNGIEIDETNLMDSYPKLAIMLRPTTMLEPITKIQAGMQYSFDKLFALKSSFGYSFKTSDDYINIIDGNEPGIKWAIETRQELIMRMVPTYKSYKVNSNEMYSRYYVSLEGAYRRKQHKEIQISEYSNIGTITYNTPSFSSNIYMAHAKVGVQIVISNKVYFDPYIGLGIKIYRYNENELNSYFVRGNTYNRELPNMTAGFDLGILIK